MEEQEQSISPTDKNEPEQSISLTDKNWSGRLNGWKCRLLSKPENIYARTTSDDAKPEDFVLHEIDTLFKNRIRIIRWSKPDAHPKKITVFFKSKFSPFEKKKIIQKKKELLVAYIGLGISAIVLFFVVLDHKEFFFSEKEHSLSPIKRAPWAGNIMHDSETIHIHYLDDDLYIAKRNANFDRYNDDSLIVHATNSKTWDSCNQKRVGCWCYYQKADKKVDSSWGKLYNGYAVLDTLHHGVVPLDCHLIHLHEIDKILRIKWPTQEGYNLKSKNGWAKRQDGTFGGGCNSVGFNGRPYGYCTPNFDFEGADTVTCWWTTDRGKHIYSDFQVYYYCTLRADKDSLNYFEQQLQFGYYIRCVRGKP